jgi:hypothetical protein
MPHPENLSYDDYAACGLAANGCIDALDEAGMLTPEEAENIVDAWVGWAERWGALGNGGGREDWENKFEPYHDRRAGWQTLRRLAKGLIPGYAEEVAAAKFANAESAPDLPDCLEEGTTNWPSRLLLYGKGSPKACLANAITALRYAPEWHGLFVYDEFANTIRLTRRPPWARSFTERKIKDTDAIWVADWLQTNQINIGAELAGQAILAVAEMRTIHPVRASHCGR